MDYFQGLSIGIITLIMKGKCNYYKLQCKHYMFITTLRKKYDISYHIRVQNNKFLFFIFYFKQT